MKGKTIKDMSVTEMKVMVYDLSVQARIIQQRIDTLNQSVAQHSSSGDGKPGTGPVVPKPRKTILPRTKTKK